MAVKKKAAANANLNDDGTLKQFPWVFRIKRGGKAGKNHKLVVSSEHPQSDQLMKLLKGRYVQFSEYTYTTSDKVVARYLRELIRDGYPSVYEDLSSFPLRCQYSTGGKPCTWSRASCASRCAFPAFTSAAIGPINSQSTNTMMRMLFSAPSTGNCTHKYSA